MLHSLGRRVITEDEAEELEVGVCIRTAALNAAGRSRFGKEAGPMDDLARALEKWVPIIWQQLYNT